MDDTVSVRLREERLRRGLSQTQLAEMAGVSRQLVGAVEAGRHLPRVDAALGLAEALSVDVADLFGSEPEVRDVETGEPPDEGAPVRVGRVSGRLVATRAGVDGPGWGSADGLIEGGRLTMFSSLVPGPVMIGCEPGLEIIEQDLRERGLGAMAVGASSSAAIRSLDEGRAHMAVVHGANDQMPASAPTIERYRLCSWRVGLAASPDSPAGWAEAALHGNMEVIQREPGAAVQAAFVKAAVSLPPGPRSTGHIEGARMAINSGLPAVTIEPAALALGAQFHPLETHDAEVWVPGEWSADRAVEAAMGEISGQRFQKRLLGIGGYDLEHIGARAT